LETNELTHVMDFQVNKIAWKWKRSL